MDRETIREATLDKVIDDIVLLLENTGLSLYEDGISTDEVILRLIDLLSK